LFNFLSRLFLEAHAAQFHIGHVVSPDDGRLSLHGDVVVGPLAAVARLMAGIILDAHEVVGSCQQQIDEHDYVTRYIIIDYSLLTILRKFTPFARSPHTVIP